MKNETIKQSLDWLQSNDFEIIGSVLGELDMIEDFMVHSDKCDPKVLQKIEDEF